MSTPTPPPLWRTNTAPASFTPTPRPLPVPPRLAEGGEGLHQAATPALVVGIVALAAIPWAGLSLFLAPFAWALGRTARREILASGGRLTGLDRARAGIVLGMIGSGLLAMALLAFTGLLALGALGVLSTTDGP